MSQCQFSIVVLSDIYDQAPGTFRPSDSAERHELNDFPHQVGRHDYIKSSDFEAYVADTFMNSPFESTKVTRPLLGVVLVDMNKGSPRYHPSMGSPSRDADVIM